MYSPRPPPVEQDIPLLLRHPLPPPPRFCALLPAASPPPPLRFCGFPTVRAGQGGKRTRPPPLWNRMVFPFAIHTHTHHVFANVWPFYLQPPCCGTGWFFPFCSETHTHTHHVSVYVWHSLSVHALLLSLRSILPALSPPFPLPWYPVMYSCTSISNGRHGVFSPPPHPPPLWNRISLCFCGIPFPHRRGFVLCFLRHPLPHPCGLVVFQLCVRAREEREPAPPPCGTGWFSLLPYTHTHTPCLCECMAILSPNPPPVEQDGFPFCSVTHTHTHTHTHTPTTCLCMYGILSPYMLFC